MLLGVYFMTARPIKPLINTNYRSCGIVIGQNIYQDSGGTRIKVFGIYCCLRYLFHNLLL